MFVEKNSMKDFGSPVVMQVLRNLQQILIKAELTFISQEEWWQVGHFIKMKSFIKLIPESLLSQNSASSMVGIAEL